MKSCLTRKNFFVVVLCASVLGLAAAEANGRTINVRADGSGDYPTIQAAINAAVAGDEVVLQVGTYTGDGNRDIDFKGKAITVRSTDPNDADIVTATIIDCNGTSDEPHRGFCFENNEDAGSILAGVTITNGSHFSGGGIRCDMSGPVIKRCLITRNQALGAHGVSGSSGSDGSNGVGVFGGGIYCGDGSNTIISQCRVIDNSAIGGDGGNGGNGKNGSDGWWGAGGGDGSDGGNGGSGGDARGGGVYCDEGSSCTIAHCIVRDNFAASGAGGSGGNGGRGGKGALWPHPGDPPRDGGDGGNGGNGGDAGNAEGGGIWCGYYSEYTVRHCIIMDNSVTGNRGGSRGLAGAGGSGTNGGANGSKGESGYGGDNRSGYGGGVCGNTGIIHCIIRGDTADYGSEIAAVEVGGSLGYVSIWYCNIEGLESGTYASENCTVEWGLGNIDLAPMLTPDGHLLAGSPCIDSGDPNYEGVLGETDVDGELRIYGDRVDIGMDEFIDGDGDGLPDWWEEKYFGSSVRAEANEDTDGNGRNNLAEYNTGGNPVAPATVYYVDPNEGDDDFDGLSAIWDGNHGPKATIQTAIDAAADYESDVVTLAPGIYGGYGNRDIDFGGKMITVKSVNPQDANTVGNTIIDCNGSRAEPHRGFHFRSGEGRYSVLSGLTIKNGYHFSGGGILCDFSSPMISHCEIVGNVAREHETDAQNGGGICCLDNSSPIISNCTITHNVVGGEWAKHSLGGGVFCSGDSGPTIVDCKISHNWVGGSFTGDGGGIYCADNSSPIITRCMVSFNQARCMAYDRPGRGGGIYSGYNSEPKISKCTIRGNRAETGGGISSYGNAYISNCIISFNKVATKWYYEPAGCGGGVYCRSGSQPTINHCTVVGNNAKYGGGLSGCNGVIGNCIIRGNIAQKRGWELYRCAEPMYSSVENWTGGGEGNIDSDPCFVEAGFWDVNGVWVDGDYHLLPGSPCINAGDPDYIPEPGETDLDGLPRIIGGRVDMGAYEFNHLPIACIVGGDRAVEVGSSCEARLTLDGSCSSDADSSPGTNDDINDFDWYDVIDPCDPNSDIYLGSGEIIECNLPLGEHTIILEVIDKACAFDTNEVTITVEDTTPPEITLNGDATMTLECGIDSYTEEGATATDNCDPDVPVVIGGDTVDTSVCGTYVVTYDATDDSGNSAVQVTRTVIVEDTIPPEFSLSVSPDVLWPANHTMVLITPSWEVSDNCDEWPEVTLVSITSSEEDNAKGGGDGDTTGDILVDPNDGSIYLRAERNGAGSGRIYTLTYEAVDDSNNVTVDSATVTVPHDQRRHRHRYRERTGERNTKGQ